MPYTYCLGNPIALRDPTGHEAIGWSGRLRRPDEDITPQSAGGGGIEGWISVAVGAVFVAVGVATFIGSLGTSGPASLAMIAVGTALSAGSTIASAVAIANNNEEAAKWGQYLGYAAMAASAPLIVQSAFKGINQIGKSVGAAGKNTTFAPLARAGMFTPKGSRMIKAQNGGAFLNKRLVTRGTIPTAANSVNANLLDLSEFLPPRPVLNRNFINDRVITLPSSPKPNVKTSPAAGPSSPATPKNPGAKPGIGRTGPPPAASGDRNLFLEELKAKVHPKRID
jgi:hypothetical protein